MKLKKEVIACILILFFYAVNPILFSYTSFAAASSDVININANEDIVISKEENNEAAEHNNKEENKILIKTGTVVPVILDTPATSKKNKTGSRIECRVYENIKIEDVLIFKEGGRAFLNIKFAKKAAFLGIPGKLTIKDGEIFDINGKKYKVVLDEVLEGKAKLYPKVLAGISIFFLWPLALFLFVKGEQAELPAHTPIETTIPQDSTFVPVL